MKKIWITFLLGISFLFCGCEVLENKAGEPSSSQPDHSSERVEDPDNGCKHVDKDDNGECDSCTESVLRTFDFFVLNDLHGKFADTDAQPGVDELTSYLKEAKAENENTVLLSSGDMWQGSSESNLTNGLIITDWMNELDFAAMTLGNHEYDWGEEKILQNGSVAEFPFLAINIYDRSTNALVEYCQPSVMFEKNGVKIGIIGAIGDCYSSISSDKVEDVYFKTGSQLTALVKAESQKLRAAGADFIVYSLHDGYGSSSTSTTTVSDSSIASYYDVALSDGYVDLVFEGHTHQRYVLRDSKGVYHLQDGGDNDGVSHAEITVNYVNDTYVVNEAKFIATDVYSESYEGDPIVSTLMGKYEEQIALAGKVLGENDRLRDGDELRQVVADRYYEVGVEKWGDTYDIVLGGGYQSVRSPYNLQAGQVLYGDVQSIFPFDNPLVLCSVSGSKLKSRFFETTNENYFISYGDYGALVKENIDTEKTYYIVTDTYSSSFAPNGLTEIERYDDTTYARDLLAAYIEAGGFVTDLSEITLTSIPEVLEIGEALADSQETITQYFVKGKIISTPNSTYGNLTIEDEDGNHLYVYGVYDSTGSIRYDSLTTKPQVGDTVVLEGKIKKYVNTTYDTVQIEMINGKLHSIE